MDDIDPGLGESQEGSPLDLAWDDSETYGGWISVVTECWQVMGASSPFRHSCGLVPCLGVRTSGAFCCWYASAVTCLSFPAR